MSLCVGYLKVLRILEKGEGRNRGREEREREGRKRGEREGRKRERGKRERGKRERERERVVIVMLKLSRTPTE